MNDPIGDMITRIKNAGGARKASTCFPYSNLKMVIAEKLREKGFIGEVVKRGKVKPQIEVEILYDEVKKPVINNINRMSKLSRRLYRGYKDIKPIRRGHGVLIVSTPNQFA